MRLSYWAFTFLLIFAPLAFGTAELWSLITVEMLAGFASIALFLPIWFYRGQFYKVPGILPLLLLLCFIGIQLIPLPLSLVELLSPNAAKTYLPYTTISGKSWIPLSVNQHETVQELIRLTSYTAVYILTIQLLAKYEYLKRTVTLVVYLAAAIGLVALIQHVGSPYKIYWFREIQYNVTPFGPWVNESQFAAFMEMLAPLGLALYLFYKPRVPEESSLREKIVAFFNVSGSNNHIILGWATLMIAFSVFVSLSKGGILSLCFSILVFILLYNLKHGRRGFGYITIFILCMWMTISWMGWDVVSSEFNRAIDESGNLHDGRFDLWRETFQIIKAYFLVGSGFGTFADVYPGVKSLSHDIYFYHAHNDYLEMLTDGGIIGFCLASWFIFSVIRHGWLMVRARRDQYAVLLGIGCLAGLAAVLVHSIIDFPLHNGAVGLYFFFLCGVLVTAVNSRFSHYESTTLLRVQQKRYSIVYLVAAFTLTVVAATIQFGVSRGSIAYNAVSNIYISQHLHKAIFKEVTSKVTTAEKFDPLEDVYSYKLGSLHWFKQETQKAEDALVRAIRKKPMDGNSLQRLGLIVDEPEIAELLLSEGYRRGTEKNDQALTYVTYLFEHGRDIEAKAVIAERLQVETSQLTLWVAVFEDNGLTRDEIKELLPRSVQVWIKMGTIMKALGNSDETEFYMSNALDFLESEEHIKQEWFVLLSQYYREVQNHDKAFEILRKAVEYLPEHVGFRVQLGRYYQHNSIFYRAEEEYRRVLLLDPSNYDARKGLRQMGLEDAY